MPRQERSSLAGSREHVQTRELWQAGSGQSQVQAQLKEGMAGGVGRAAATPELLEVREAKKGEGPQDKEFP